MQARRVARSLLDEVAHFKREEDATMERGKLDEELDRMSAITDSIKPGGLLLCNESFASTNEREGSQLAREVIRALTEAGIRILFVTHMYDLAERIHARGDDRVLFLRAEREPDGSRTHRLFEAAPLPTSYGEDLYREAFGIGPETTLQQARTAKNGTVQQPDSLSSSSVQPDPTFFSAKQFVMAGWLVPVVVVIDFAARSHRPAVPGGFAGLLIE
jgi:DNA mismatch repair ATPase MutS